MSTEDGLITIASRHSVKETLDRLEASLKAKGISVFARIDHAAGAKSVGMDLRPTEVLIFGNPKTGTPLMQASQTIGIDLPRLQRCPALDRPQFLGQHCGSSVLTN